MVKSFLLLGSLGLSLLIAQPAAACSCVANTDDLRPTQFSEADAVFTGQVVRVRAVRSPDGPDLPDTMIALIRVTESFKGADSRLVEVQTSSQSSMCGYNFDAGEEYLVWAYEQEAGGMLSTNSCSRTMPVERAEADLQWLNEQSTEN